MRLCVSHEKRFPYDCTTLSIKQIYMCVVIDKPEQQQLIMVQ